MKNVKIGEIIKDNRKKIIKGAVIAASLVAGIMIMKGLTNNSEGRFLGTVENFVLDDYSATLDTVKDVAETV